MNIRINSSARVNRGRVELRNSERGVEMASTQLPGTAAQRCVITDACRSSRGDDGAIEEALSRLRKVYEQVTAGWQVGEGVQIHLALTVERPANLPAAA